MKRDGIVLMMTLILISVITGIITLILTQSERMSRLSENSFSQSAALSVVSDLELRLPSLLSSVTGAEQLDLAMRLPLQLETKKGDFMLKARLFSPYNRLNINRIVTAEGQINEPYAAALMRIFAIYPIADTELFLKLVFDSIDTDFIERGNNTEIAEAQPDFKNGSIANEHQFNILLERYIELSGDRTVLSIPWNDYIGYEGERMDFNAVNPEALSLVLPTIPPEKIRALTLYRTKAYATKEEAIAAEPALASVFDAYFFIYQPRISYDLVCDIQIQENFRNEHLLFRYNLLDKKAQHVEFL